MDKFIRIAENKTVDPMDVVLEWLFESKEDIFISNEVLEMMKASHSYTGMPNGDSYVYRFHKRPRGTSAFFSFFVITGSNGNKVSKVECTTELGLTDSKNDSTQDMPKEMVYLMLQSEEEL